MLTPEQKAQRVGRVTSSTLAAALGRSKRNSRLQGWCWIVGEPYLKHAQRGCGAPEVGEDAGRPRIFERGDDLEPMALNWGARTLQCTTEPAPFVTRDSWSGDSTDALYTHTQTGELYLAEAKTVSPREAENWGQEMTDQIPIDYLLQCRWHLIHHPGVELCYVPWIGGYDFTYHLHVVQRDEAKQKELVEQAHAFWREFVEPRVPPPVGDLDTDYLTAKHPKDNGKSFEPTEELDALVELSCKWRDRRELAEQRYQESQNRIRDILKEYASVECPRYKISYRTAKDTLKTDWEALARACGATEAQIREHTSTGYGARRLLVTGRQDLAKPKKGTKKEA